MPDQTKLYEADSIRASTKFELEQALHIFDAQMATFRALIMTEPPGLHEWMNARYEELEKTQKSITKAMKMMTELWELGYRLEARTLRAAQEIEERRKVMKLARGEEPKNEGEE